MAVLGSTYINGDLNILGDNGNAAKKNINNYFPHTNYTGSLEIASDGSSWSEGIRIHAASNLWCGIVLCDSTNTGSTGTGAKTWSMHNNEGTFGIYKNGSNASATQYFRNENNAWAMSSGLSVTGDINATGYCNKLKFIAEVTELTLASSILTSNGDYLLIPNSRSSFGYGGIYNNSTILWCFGCAQVVHKPRYNQPIVNDNGVLFSKQNLQKNI